MGDGPTASSSVLDSSPTQKVPPPTVMSGHASTTEPFATWERRRTISPPSVMKCRALTDRSGGARYGPPPPPTPRGPPGAPVAPRHAALLRGGGEGLPPPRPPAGGGGGPGAGGAAPPRGG